MVSADGLSTKEYAVIGGEKRGFIFEQSPNILYRGVD